MTDAERTSRWSRRFVLTGAVFLVVWHVVLLLENAPAAVLVFGLLGFVFHTIFGKAYSLIPTYFDRDLATTRFLPVHYGLVVAGTVLLGGDVLADQKVLSHVGIILWTAGVAVFLGTIAWTIHDNLTGRETATGTEKQARRFVDRVANGFMPIALLYLAVGTVALFGQVTETWTLFDGMRAQVTHLLAAGTGALLVFSIGFRLLPRFLAAKPPRILVVVVLGTGAIAPLMLTLGLTDRTLLQTGAILQTVAIAGFAIAFWWLYYQSDRRRVGFYGVLACTVAGLLGVSLGAHFAFDGIDSTMLVAHQRLNVLGFLGLAIVGVSYQFYPPNVGTMPGVGDRLALGIIGVLFGGLLLEVAGLLMDHSGVVTASRVLVLVGALAHVYLLLSLFHERYG